jgi:hypothetical protein
MSKTSEVAEGLYLLVVGLSGPKIRQEFSSAQSRKIFPRLVLSSEFQPTFLAFRSSANKTGSPPLKQVVRSTPVSRREGER